jgi:hypothetical protein
VSLPDGEEGLAAVVEVPGGRGSVVAKRMQLLTMARSNGACRCSGSARQQRRAPMVLAKVNGRVRSRRTSGSQRTKSRERRGRGACNLPQFLSQHSGEIKLSPARESQRLWLWLWAMRLVCWGCK